MILEREVIELLREKRMQATASARQRVLAHAAAAMKSTTRVRRGSQRSGLWWKTGSGLAASVVIAAAVWLLLPVGGRVAFAAVLEQLQTTPFACVATFRDAGEEDETRLRMLVAPPTWVRLEPGGGGDGESESLATLINVRTGAATLFWLDRKIAMPMKLDDEPLDDSWLQTVAAAKPLRALWGLREREAASLGQRRIDDVAAEGFRVERARVEQGGVMTMDVWADASTGWPLRLEIMLQPTDGASEGLRIAMRDFEQRPDIDRSVFDPTPEGFRLANQRTLAEWRAARAAADSRAAQEADHPVTRLIAAWEADRKADAVALLKSTDWREPRSDAPAWLAMSEPDLIALHADDREEVITLAIGKLRAVRGLARHVAALAESDAATGRLDDGLAALTAVRRLGERLSTRETLLIVESVGIAVRMLALEKQRELMEAGGREAGLAEVEVLIEAVEAQAERLRARGR